MEPLAQRGDVGIPEVIEGVPEPEGLVRCVEVPDAVADDPVPDGVLDHHVGPVVQAVEAVVHGALDEEVRHGPVTPGLWGALPDDVALEVHHEGPRPRGEAATDQDVAVVDHAHVDVPPPGAHGALVGPDRPALHVQEDQDQGLVRRGPREYVGQVPSVPGLRGVVEVHGPAHPAGGAGAGGAGQGPGPGIAGHRREIVLRVRREADDDHLVLRDGRPVSDAMGHQAVEADLDPRRGRGRGGPTDDAGQVTDRVGLDGQPRDVDGGRGVRCGVRRGLSLRGVRGDRGGARVGAGSGEQEEEADGVETQGTEAQKLTQEERQVLWPT